LQLLIGKALFLNQQNQGRHKFLLEDSLTIRTDEDPQVTAIISHVVRSGREQGYEQWFHGIATDARKFKGI